MTGYPAQDESTFAASIEKLRNEFERWLDTAMSQGGRALDRMGWKSGTRTLYPPVDILETPEEIRVHVDLPGIEPASIEVSLAGNMLTLKGEKAALSPASGETIHLNERAHGSFSRSIPLPVPVNEEDVEAESKNGVLQIRLAKSEQARARQIPIRSEQPPTSP